MLILDPWTAHRLVRGMVAYHDARNRNADPEGAFRVASGMTFSSEHVPQVLVDYPDLNAAACAVLDLDRAYRDQTDWSPEKITEWTDSRKKAMDRLDMVRLFVDANLKGFNWPSPAEAT